MATIEEPRPGPVPGCGCRPRARRKEVRELIRQIELAGARVEASGTNHFKVYLGERYIGGLAATPSDHRALANDIARFRRAGLALNSKGRYQP
jgi:hypothetical protein